MSAAVKLRAGLFEIECTPEGYDRLGFLVWKLRELHGWTLAQAAEVAGICPATLDRLEIGEYARGPYLPTVVAVFEAYGIALAVDVGTSKKLAVLRSVA